MRFGNIGDIGDRKRGVTWEKLAEIRKIIGNLNRENISAHASGTAFFLFLSLIPMIMLICSALSFTPFLKESDLMEAVRLLPSSVIPLLITLIENIYDSTFGILSAAAIATVWSAGKGILALMRGLNAMNGVVEKRNYLFQRLIASFYLVVFLVMILFLLIVMVFGNLLAGMLIQRLPTLAHLFDLLFCFREVFSCLVLIVVFMLMYTFLPSCRLKWRKQLPGAVFSAVSWILFSWGFSLYIEFSASLSMYGSLTAIIIVMLWLYFGCYLLLIGAYLNRRYELW